MKENEEIEKIEKQSKTVRIVYKFYVCFYLFFFLYIYIYIYIYIYKKNRYNNLHNILLI